MINEKKDACYHKVKSRYRVWPSAYASGALVKCRQKGADNWGDNSEKKVAESVFNAYTNLAFALAEMKEKFPADQEARAEKARLASWKAGKKPKSEVTAQYNRISNKIQKRQDAIQKQLEQEADIQQKRMRQKRMERKRMERQDESKKGVMPKMKMGVHKSRAGGLTQKGVEAYRAANPGSKLKTAVTTKPSKLKKGSKSAKRRASFCARMGGMKKRLTSSKTANDPNSRINKALRKWNC